jgi:hypothetical protein
MAIRKDILTPKQQAFVRAIAQGAGAIEAYRTAFGEASIGSLNTKSRMLMRLPKLQPFIEAAKLQYATHMESATERAAIERSDRHHALLEELDLSRERVLRELVRVAFADLRQVARWDAEGTMRVKTSDEMADEDAAVLAEIVPGPKSVRLKLHDKLSALATLARIMGLFDEAKKESGESTLNLSINIVPPEDDMKDAAVAG